MCALKTRLKTSVVTPATDRLHRATTTVCRDLLLFRYNTIHRDINDPFEGGVKSESTNQPAGDDDDDNDNEWVWTSATRVRRPTTTIIADDDACRKLLSIFHLPAATATSLPRPTVHGTCRPSPDVLESLNNNSFYVQFRAISCQPAVSQRPAGIMHEYAVQSTTGAALMGKIWCILMAMTVCCPVAYHW